MQRLLICILLLGSFLSADSVQQIRSTGNANNNSEILWTIEVPDSTAITLNPNGLSYEGWNQTILDNGIHLPVKSKLVYTKATPPDVQIERGTLQLLNIDNIDGPSSEQAKGLDLEVLPTQTSIQNPFQIKHIQESNGYHLWAVNILGAQYLELEGRWVIPEYLNLQITTDLGSTAVVESNGLYLNQVFPSSNQTVARTENGLGEGKLKLQVLEDGIYRIFYDSLLNVPDFQDVQIPSRTLKLREQGQERAIHVYDHGDGLFDSGDYFDFIGKQNYFDGGTQYYDPFSDINVYWLDWGGDNGLRFVEESGSLVDLTPVRPTTFWDIVHIEEDNDFERLGQVDTDMPSITRDHYFWESVNSGVTKEVDFFLADPFRGSSENLQVSLGLHGLTYSETAGEEKSHTLYAFMNDNSIGEGSWVQQEEYVLTSPSALNLSHNILFPSGDNTLAIFAPVSTEPGNYDKIVLNWIEIGYEHLLVAEEDQLRFRKSHINPSTNLEFEIKGFQSQELVLYKEGLSKLTGFSIRENWDADIPQYSLVFQDQATTATPDYWAASVNGLLQPVNISVDTSAALRQQDADLIVIAIPEFIAELEPYLEFKRSEGWNPIAVSVADIYDEFNYGIHSPKAIKWFLTYANNNWSSKPEYAVLFGDAISNPQQAKRDTGIQNIPTFYMQTYGWGAAEADYWYSLINGDDYIPDMHIGRIPCNDTEDLANTIQKLVAYGSASNYGTWQNELITIAGFDAVFKTQSQSLLRNTIPQAYMPSRIFIDRDSEGQIFWGDTDSLVEQWNHGKLFINFLGHGGGAVWADRSLFVRDDINYLDNTTPPAFVTSMTCFTASFAQTRGLGEVVLTESPTGAIGWFGSTGVGWVINDYLMIQPLMRRLLEDDKPVGEIIDIARMEYFLASSGYDYLKPSMLFQYNYLGDPTTRLLRPEMGELLSSQKSIYTPDDQIHLTYQDEIDGEIKLLPLNANNEPWWSAPVTYPTQSTSSFLITQEQTPTTGSSRTVYSLDRGENESSIQGYVSYSIASDWFEHQSPSAAQLSESPVIPISVRFHGGTVDADSMVLVFSGANNARVDLEAEGEWWVLPNSHRLQAGTSNTYYYFSAYSEGNHLQSSSTYTLYLPRDISLSIRDIRDGVKANRCGVYVDYSLSGISLATATLEFEADKSDGTETLQKTIGVNEGSNSVFIPIILGNDPVTVHCSLRIASDVDTTDNALEKIITTQYFQIIPGLGLTFDGEFTDTLSVWSNGTLFAEYSDTSWVRVLTYTSPVTTLPGVILYQDSSVYLIESYSEGIIFNVLSPLELFTKDLGLPSWEYVPSVQSNLHREAEFRSRANSTLMAMGQKQNFSGPDVSMMVEGQLFFDGDYLLNTSHLNLLGEDENGFNWDDTSVRVTLDGTPVDVMLGDTTESGQIISAIVELEMEVGEHTILYQMSDALGNWSNEVSVSGVVAGEAAIYDYGNFPNPFEGETTIIYELTQPLDDVVIDIYTLAGYKLHTIDGFNARVSIDLGAIGYHEVPWNGRDRSGDFVANGVYFYRIRGSLKEDDVIGPVGKMVKNR